MSSEPSTDGDLSAEGSETSTSDGSSRVSTMARTVARQLESHLLGSGVEELGGTRTQTRALNREATSLVTMFGPDEGGKYSMGYRRHGRLPVRCVSYLNVSSGKQGRRQFHTCGVLGRVG